MSDAPSRPSLDHLRAELLAIDRDLRAADAIGWGQIGFELAIAVQALSPYSTVPLDTDVAERAIDPKSLRDRLVSIRAELELRLAAGTLPMVEVSIALAASAVGDAIVRVLREVGGFARTANQLVAVILPAGARGAA